MAFMVPLVKNHYDIYARNNPADHHNNGNNGGTNGAGITGKSGNLVHDPASNSLILSATSLGKSGAPVKKQYRIILSGGQVVTNGNNGGAKKKVPGNAGANFVTANGKAYYRMPSASISLPVNGRGPRGGPGIPRRSSKSTSEAGGTGSVRSTPTSPEHRSNSSSNGSSSPGSPPHYPSSRPPHSSASICQQPTSGSFRRTSAGVRSPQSGGNRLYSYSVSIPEDEEKKVKESLNSLLADKENLVDQESQLEDDHQLLAIFATSAPGGTGALEEASLVKPPPSLKLMKKKMAKKPLVQKSASLNAASPLPLVETKLVHHHSISPSSPPASPPASPTSSPPASPSPSPSPSPPPPITTTSREYVELLRKFILHLKMLKIGNSSSNNNNNNSSSKQRKQSKKSSVKSVKSNGVDKEESLSAAAVAAVDDSAVDAVEVGSSEVSSEDSTSAPKRARKRKDTMEDSKDL